MAVGDAVNVNMGAPVVNTFQPAAGVTIMVLKSMFGSPANASVGFTNGTTNTYEYTTNGWANGATYAFNTTGNKFPITNTNYYYNDSSHTTKGFAGIQIQ